MSTYITKTWLDGEKVVTQEISESEVYKQDPVAWYDKNGMLTHHPFKGVIPLYRAPYPWVGLTDEEVQEIMEKTVATCSELDDFTGYTARLTWKNCEAKLREKNGG